MSKCMERNKMLRLEIERLRAELKVKTKPNRKDVTKRDNYTCRLCGDKKEELFVHHLTPKANGGTNKSDNYITVCESCHMFMHCNPKLIMRRNERLKKSIADSRLKNKTWGRPKGSKDIESRKKSGYFGNTNRFKKRSFRSRHPKNLTLEIE